MKGVNFPKLIMCTGCLYISICRTSVETAYKVTGRSPSLGLHPVMREMMRVYSNILAPEEEVPPSPVESGQLVEKRGNEPVTSDWLRQLLQHVSGGLLVLQEFGHYLNESRLGQPKYY